MKLTSMRSFAVFIAVVLTSSLACRATGTAGTSKSAAPSRPNILVIITDQQHSDMLSCAGNPYVKTPNMDRLAADGTRFARAYASNPVCVPSRFSLMTGQMPSSIGLENNDEDRNPVPQGMLSNAMGEVFRKAGYETVYAGKVHVPGQEGVRGNPFAYGFEKRIAPTDIIGREPTVAACVQFIKQSHEKPFLLVASLINPHDICYMAIRDYYKDTGEKKWGLDRVAIEQLDKALALPPGVSEKEFFDKYCPPVPANYEVPNQELSGMFLDKAADGAFILWARQNWSERAWRLHRWAYARLTEAVDVQIGSILNALRGAGLEDTTLVAMTSDHGDQDGAHRLVHKGFFYEESIRIPLIFRWKGVVKAGQVDREHLVCNGTDLLPTLCDFSQLPISSRYPGRSLKPLAEGRRVSGWRQHLIIETQFARLVHMGSWKYMVGMDQNIISGKYRPFVPRKYVREVLVDLETDPGEMIGLTDAKHHLQLEKGRRLLREWNNNHHDHFRARYEISEQQSQQ